MTDFARNGFLNALSVTDRRLLEPHTSSVPLTHGTQLQEQNDRIEFAYFPIRGLISLLAIMKSGAAVESAMISASGAANISVGLGRPRAVSRAIVQAPGMALRIAAGPLLKAARQSATLVTRIARHEQNLLAQIQQTAACNSIHTSEQRLARWLLQAQGQLADDEVIPFTQEFLSHILGVRRSTVTLIASTMQRKGSISYARGRITILDRPALKRTACECYEVVQNLTSEFAPASKSRRR